MNIIDIKKNNRNRIYFYIRDNDLVTRQDIAYDLQLSLPTITQNLDYLLDHGLISSNQKIISKTGGRNPMAYSCVSDAKVAIGLDITQNHIKTIVVDLKGEVIKYVYKRESYRRSDDYLRTLGKEVENIINSAQLDPEKILGVGIAVPGIIDHEKGYVIQGRVIDNEGMTCEEFSKYIPYQTKLIHDSYAAGYSEIWMTPDIHNIYYFNLCNSVGGCVLINDEVYTGDGLYSGEVGHLNLIPNGETCYCGQRGCFDAYCNAEVLSKHTDGNLDMFFQKLEEKDDALQKVWDEYLENLATAITDIRMLFGCTVIIGGYVGTYIKEYLEVLREKVDAKSPFGDLSLSSDYLIPCKNKIESVATGAALFFVEDFFNNI